MLIPFSPRHLKHPDTFAVSKPTPGDQLLAFMLRSKEAEERVGSRVRRTLSSFKELLRFNFNYDAFSPSPPAHEPQSTKPPQSPLVFSWDPGTDLHHCLWMSVRVTVSGRGPTLNLSFFIPCLQSPPSPRNFSVLCFSALIVPQRGRVLFACLTTRSQEPSP